MPSLSVLCCTDARYRREWESHVRIVCSERGLNVLLEHSGNGVYFAWGMTPEAKTEIEDWWYGFTYGVHCAERRAEKLRMRARTEDNELAIAEARYADVVI